MARENEAGALDGVVEVNGAYFGGYVKLANRKDDCRDRRLLANQSGKRQSVIVARERDGDILTLVGKNEVVGGTAMVKRIAPDAVIHADEASHWDALRSSHKARRINHSVCYSDGTACINQAESFFSRLRRAGVGTHHHIAGPHLNAYASELAFREENRWVGNGGLAAVVTRAAVDSPVSRVWAGYWQRAA